MLELLEVEMSRFNEKIHNGQYFPEATRRMAPFRRAAGIRIARNRVHLCSRDHSLCYTNDATARKISHGENQLLDAAFQTKIRTTPSRLSK